MLKIEDLIEYRIVRDTEVGAVMAADLFFAGQRLHAQMIVWKRGSEVTVDLLSKTKHCLESMLLSGLHEWVEHVVQPGEAKAEPGHDEQHV